MEAIKRDFGTFEEMKSKLSSKSVTVQGSGWGWLVRGFTMYIFVAVYV